MRKKYLCMYSGGLASDAAARRVAAEHGHGSVHLLFADTLIEDDDLYRFLIESAADIMGLAVAAVADLARRALALPPVEDDARWPERKAALASLRAEATARIPRLHWIADGRTPWEVFEGERFIGNSRVDPCSRVLKRELMAAYRDAHFRNWDTTLVFGLDWSERGRIDGGGAKRGHRLLTLDRGWLPCYPMDARPYLTRDEMAARLGDRGITPPRLYGLGFAHNNCGGFCCKMGHGAARNLLTQLPRRYAWHAARELAAIETIGPTAKPFLKRRRDGETTGVTMGRFARVCMRLPLAYAGHGGGCGGGCALES